MVRKNVPRSKKCRPDNTMVSVQSSQKNHAEASLPLLPPLQPMTSRQAAAECPDTFATFTADKRRTFPCTDRSYPPARPLKPARS